MRASGWMFVAVVIVTVPLAIGFANQQDWATYAFIAMGGVVAIAAAVRAVIPKQRSKTTTNAIASAGEMYNELYMAQAPRPVVFGNMTGPVAEELVEPKNDGLQSGKIVLDMSRPTS
jgi:hypothetical protein